MDKRKYFRPEVECITTVCSGIVVCNSIVIAGNKQPNINPDPNKSGDYGGTLAKEQLAFDESFTDEAEESSTLHPHYSPWDE